MTFHPIKFKKDIEERINTIIDNISKDFSIETISKSPARFNQKKLDWFNQQYIQKLPLDEYISRSVCLLNKNNLKLEFTEEKNVYLEGRKLVNNPVDISSFTFIGSEIIDNLKINYHYKTSNQKENDCNINIWLLNNWLLERGFGELPLNSKDIKLKLAYKLDQNRATTLIDLGAESNCITNYSKPSTDEVKWRKNTLEESIQSLDNLNQNILSNIDFWKNSLLKVLPELSTYPQFHEINTIEELDMFYNERFLTKENIDDLYLNLVQEFENTGKNYLSENDFDFGLYLWPSRIALSGKTKSPSIFELMPVLGVKEVNKRVLGFL